MVQKAKTTPNGIQMDQYGNLISAPGGTIQYNTPIESQGTSTMTAAVQNALKSSLDKDIVAGRKFGQEVLGKDGLGRLSKNASINDLRGSLVNQTKNRMNQMVSGAPQIAQTNLTQQNLERLGNVREASIDSVGNLDAIQQGNEQGYVQNAYDRMQNIANQGLSRQELQAEREGLTQQLQRAQQTASRSALAQQGQTGVQGAVAGRQLMDINMQAANQRAGIARDLFLKSEQVKREGAGNLANLAMQRQSGEDARNQAFQSLNLNRGQSLLQAQQNRSINENQMNQARDISLMNAGQQRSQAQANMNSQLQLNQANLDANRVQSNEQLFQGRQSNYEQSLANRMSTETALATFDLGQSAKEKSMLAQTSLGYGALGAAERGAKLSADASIAAAAAQSGGGKIICTELHKQGYLSDEVMKLDAEYGIKLRNEKYHVYVGYVAWAQYVVIGMKKSKNFTKLVHKFAAPWSEHMAYNNNKLGKVLTFIGESICGIIGKMILSKKQVVGA